MALDQYRLQPLPPRKKPIWKILTFGVVAILLISMISYSFLNPRIVCEGTGGKWLPHLRWEPINVTVYTDSSEQLREEERDFHGKCYR